MADAPVVDDARASRYEMAVAGGVAFMNYERDGTRVALLHTEVPPELEGRGIGTRLVRGVLDLARARGDRVVPRCPFVRSFMRRHLEYDDLVADG